ncbi:unnamed protein product [Nesidiocoris tenuis]|uniref:Uncharacterized protein n=1 Tax=Nesidiocoris tenuis TaxID=355587 RepID=A0A6H5GR89_9HEMI|nr:unnamed protein product [Nesidiocoris tenuis]
MLFGKLKSGNLMLKTTSFNHDHEPSDNQFRYRHQATENLFSFRKGKVFNNDQAQPVTNTDVEVRKGEEGIKLRTRETNSGTRRPHVKLCGKSERFIFRFKAALPSRRVFSRNGKFGRQLALFVNSRAKGAYTYTFKKYIANYGEKGGGKTNLTTLVALAWRERGRGRIGSWDRREMAGNIEAFSPPLTGLTFPTKPFYHQYLFLPWYP